MTSAPGSISLWIMAARPRTLPAGIAPVILGAAAAHDAGMRLWVSLFALVCCMLLQIGTNLANDYFDAVHGIDGQGRLGPRRVTQSGLLPAQSVRRAFTGCFAAAAVFGLPLVVEGGAPVFVIGVLSILFAYLYTGGPFPLAYFAMGEVLAFVFYGLVATGGVYYLNTGAISAGALVAGAGTGFIAAFLMGVNNLRDIHTDRAAGKTTVAVLLGERGARWFAAGLAAGSLCAPPVYLFLYPDKPLVLLALAGILPFAPRIREVVSAPIDAGFNRILAAAGQYVFVYAVLFSAGIMI